MEIGGTLPSHRGSSLPRASRSSAIRSPSSQRSRRRRAKSSPSSRGVARGCRSRGRGRRGEAAGEDGEEAPADAEAEASGDEDTRRGVDPCFSSSVWGTGAAGTTRNRQNVGVMVVDELARRHGGSWKAKFAGQMAQVRVGVETLALLKPETYMNDSGRSVGPPRRFKLDPDAVLVVHDRGTSTSAASS